jgi:glucose-1-phosphate thymidylyltransferase
VVEFDKEFNALSIEEKPLKPNLILRFLACTFYDNCRNCQNIKPSARGEYEITDINKVYLEKEH